MRLHDLMQVIVPLTFLAIWALTSLLNREEKPPARRPGPASGIWSHTRTGPSNPTTSAPAPTATSRNPSGGAIGAPVPAPNS